MKRDLVKRNRLLTLATAVAFGLLASGAAYAQSYTFRTIITSKEYGGSLWQVGDLNNLGHFSFNIVGSEKDSGGGGETTYYYNGVEVYRVQPRDTPKLSDGSTLVSGSHWTPHGINNAGKMAFVADTDKSPHAIVVFNSTDRSYTLIANNQTVVEGGRLTSQGVSLEGRMLADINDRDQVVWSEGLILTGEEDAHDAVFLFDPAENKITTIARKGTALPGGKTVLNALFPNINENGEIVFMANTTDDANFGVYQWANGNITAIATPGTQVDGVTIAQAKLPRNSVGHIVFRGETVSSGGAVPVREDTGFFIHTGGRLRKIVVPGDSLPGGKRFVETEGNRRAIGVNNNGLVVFKAIMENEETGLYLWRDGQLTPLLTSGQSIEVAGRVDSLVQGIADFTGYHLGINDHGDVCFSGLFDGESAFVIAMAPR